MNSEDKSTISSRKDEHLKLCIEEDIIYENITTGFECIKLHINSVSKIVNFDDIDLSTEFLGKIIDYPLIISGMTGGSKLGQKYNKIIAEACQEKNIAMGVGSQRAAIENPELAKTFQVRDKAPDIPLVANLGVAQFIDGYKVEEAEQVIEMIKADALAVHVNPMQEFIQKEGDFKFSAAFESLKSLSDSLSFSLIIKGVGTGFSQQDAILLQKLELYALDIAGAGGTNWKKVEVLRNPKLKYISNSFLNLGIPTIKSLTNVLSYRNLGIPSIRNFIKLARSSPSDIKKLIVSGGMWSGTDAIKALLLGGNYVAFALPALRAIAKGGKEELISLLNSYIFEMKAIMSILGYDNLETLREKRNNGFWVDNKAFKRL
ncbi:MAG: type 2 isopentenyl-diphosphate Delta-isomerase [Candidatus Heimdallarchaeota archaeon]|nr:type 2 isopentenyl-diphosphate Delta-isomerase [Candidatus Heimdallarchaeota archaeon]MCK4877503.1 alpha-hydroxy-acid oxidizing protein [Candidatus Heimdallarchaeota archaeon]